MNVRLAQRKQLVADSVACVLSLQGPAAKALYEKGATKSNLLRALACAWDWLERVPRSCLLLDERLLSLTLVRMGVKCEFTQTEESTTVAVKLFGAMADKLALNALECRLLMSESSWKTQPLARAAFASGPLGRDQP